MAKRGRKPGKNRKGYWYEEQEENFKQYLKCENIDQWNVYPYHQIKLPTGTIKIK